MHKPESVLEKVTHKLFWAFENQTDPTRWPDLGLIKKKYLSTEKYCCSSERLSENDWFGLVSLFNDISTFVGYLIPKLLSKKNSSGTK